MPFANAPTPVKHETRVCQATFLLFIQSNMDYFFAIINTQFLTRFRDRSSVTPTYRVLNIHKKQYGDRRRQNKIQTERRPGIE